MAAAGPASPEVIESAWARLQSAAQSARAVRLVDLFEAEPERMERMTLDAGGLHLDFAKQAWTGEGLDAALALARAVDVEGARESMFAGDAINTSEHRAVLHAALRAPDGSSFAAAGRPVSAQVDAMRRRIAEFADGVRSGEIKGATGERIRAVLHIGIGGSDLGPRLVWEALKPLKPGIELHFAANVDGSEIAAALEGLDPRSTLVVIVSKTFTTQETMANAEAARGWLRATMGPSGDAHLVAVSASPEKAEAFGVPKERVFAFWDWVGGRYSIWSAVGLSCAIALGWPAFRRFLSGAADMDGHFRTAPLDRNAPVLMALAQVFNRDGLGRDIRAVVPYAQRLRLFPAFLQQLEMESNGKRIRKDGTAALHGTAAAVFGDAGTNGQHAFFQHLHQGAEVIPVDFVLAAECDEGPVGMHAKLLANGLAQAEALMVGRAEAEVRKELADKDLDPEEIDQLAPQRAFPGNRPSTIVLMDRLSPETLGALLALYEHKTFVEGVVWGINSFDQWGVELGKTLAARILPELESGTRNKHDPSTTALIARLSAQPTRT